MDSFSGLSLTIFPVQFSGATSERTNLRRELNQATANKMLSTKIRFQPIIDLAASKFQQWHIELDRRNIRTAHEKFDQPIVVSENNQRTWMKQSVIKFESVGELSVTFLPAVVEDARLTVGLAIFIQMRTPSGNGDTYCIADFNETSYLIRNMKPGRFAFKDYPGKLENPIEDKECVSTLSDALDQIIGYTVDLASISANSNTDRSK